MKPAKTKVCVRVKCSSCDHVVPARALHTSDFDEKEKARPASNFDVKRNIRHTFDIDDKCPVCRKIFRGHVECVQEDEKIKDIEPSAQIQGGRVVDFGIEIETIGHGMPSI